MRDGANLTADDEVIAAPARPLAQVALELVLDPDDLPYLARFPGLARAGLPRPASVIWYDTPDGVLATQDLVLTKDGRDWRLERLRPGRAAEWPPASPPPVVDAGPAPATLQPHPPLDAAPFAAFEGRRRRYVAQGAELSLLYGTLRGVTAERRVCRLALQGSAATLPHLAQDLAARLRLSVPRSSLAAEGVAVARAADLPGRHAGVPRVSGQCSVSEGLTQIIGHLLDTLLHWTDRCADPSGAEPVHQARVSTRRLRSALSIYKHAAPCPELESLAPALKDCAARLGAVRDWDVFLEGAGARLAAATGDDRRITTLLRMAAATYRSLCRAAPLPRQPRLPRARDRPRLRRQPAPVGRRRRHRHPARGDRDLRHRRARAPAEAGPPRRARAGFAADRSAA
ncbi:MAG: hypothetical protein NVSMB18_32320 [Acetobacteraceae bacterium]